MLNACLKLRPQAFTPLGANAFCSNVPTTPIFPDTRDEFEHLHTNVLKKLPFKNQSFTRATEKYIRQFRTRRWQTKNILKAKDSYALKLTKQGATIDIKRAFKRLNPQDMMQMSKAVTKALIFDDKVNLPYGLGFDDYIDKLKSKMDKTTDNDGLANEMKHLITKLDFFRERDLIHFHKYIIAHKRRINFENHAKFII